MANVLVKVDGTEKVYRLEGKKEVYLYDMPICEHYVFITNSNGEYLVDGRIVSKDEGNDMYKGIMNKTRSYNSTCGKYKFVNKVDCVVSVDKIDKAIAEDLIGLYQDSIDWYTNYIDDYKQQLEAEEHNNRMERMIKALKEVQ